MVALLLLGATIVLFDRLYRSYGDLALWGLGAILAATILMAATKR